MVEIRFQARVNGKECIGCGACENVCPTEAIRVVDKKAMVTAKKCLACPNCRGVCAANAIKMIARRKPLTLGVDPLEVDQARLTELCVKARLHPHQWLCMCTATRVREGAAAVLKGARTPEQIALMTGIRSGCTTYCLQTSLRLLKAHGVEITAPPGYRWYDSTQTLWDVPEETILKYPGHFLEEDKLVFRKI